MVGDGGEFAAGKSVEDGDVFRTVVLLAASAEQVYVGVVVAKEHVVAFAVYGAGAVFIMNSP